MKNKKILHTLIACIFLLTGCSAMKAESTPQEPRAEASPVPLEPTAVNTESVPSVPPELAGGWKLAWNDEFDSPAGSSPVDTRWTYDLGGQGWGNQEWEYYTKDPGNVATDGKGLLVITAKPADPADGQKCWYGACSYTSARILTKGKYEFTYGRVEARLKLPYGQGIWPAFWMLGSNIASVGWPACGEIDIMENIGREPKTVHGTVHGSGYSGANGISFSTGLPDGKDFKDDFHIFALEWEQEELRWYVDGKLYATVNKSQFSEAKPWRFDHPHFILLNLAVGGGWPGYPDDSTSFPQQYLVDYVRVYQK